MAKRKLTDADRQAIREMREGGFTNKALAEQFGVSEQTIIRICRPELYEKNLESNKQHYAKNAQQIYQTRKANAKSYKLQFHKENDAEIISHLEKKDNVQGYIRSLILNDIKEEN